MACPCPVVRSASARLPGRAWLDRAPSYGLSTCLHGHGFRLSLGLTEQGSVVLEHNGYASMVRSQGFLTRRYGTDIEGLGLVVATLLAIEVGKTVETQRDSGMVWAEHLLTYGQGMLVQGFRLRILPLGFIERCQVLPTGFYVWMIGL